MLYNTQNFDSSCSRELSEAMNYSLLTCVMLLAAFGSVWCKAIDSELKAEDKEIEEREQLVTNRNPCVYKGNIFTIDVRKIAERFK